MSVPTVAPSGIAAAERSSAANGEVRSEPLLRPIVWSLVASVVTEVVVLRMFFRVAVFLPKEGAFGTVNDVLVPVGTFALNLSTILAFALLGWFAAAAAREGGRAMGLALGSFVACSMLAAAGVASGPIAPLTFAAATALVAWPAVRQTSFVADRGRSNAERLAIGLTAAVLLLSAYSSFASSLRGSVLGSPPGAVTAQLVGESLIVAAIVAFAAARRREGRIPVRAVVLGAVPALVFASAWQANGATAGILALWATGLRLYLPAWVYVASVWALGATVVARTGDGSCRAAGLLVLGCAGFLLESTYAMALALVALVLLCGTPVRSRSAGIDVSDGAGVGFTNA